MIGLTEHIKVTVIRTAAGARSGPIGGGCGISAPSYYVAGHLGLQEPVGCGNFRTLYDPSGPRKVINIMNFCRAPSSEFFAFDRLNLIDQLDLQCELQAGDEIICLWKPLYVLDSHLWFSDTKKLKSIPATKPTGSSVVVPSVVSASTPSVVPAPNPSASPMFRYVRLK